MAKTKSSGADAPTPAPTSGDPIQPQEFVLGTNAGGELCFGNRERLAEFAKVASEQVSVLLELLIKTGNDDGLLFVAFESVADLAFQVSQAVSLLVHEEARHG